jgi:hypothetical protein
MRHEAKSRQAKLKAALDGATSSLLKLCPSLRPQQVEDFLSRVETGQIDDLDPRRYKP